MSAVLDNQKKTNFPRRWHKPIDEVRRLAGPIGAALTEDDLYRLDQAMYAMAKAFVKQRVHVDQLEQAG